MKKLWCLGYFIVWCVFFDATATHAAGIKTPGIGSQAMAKGGAFIAEADDWTAIYWNPAGLSQLQDQHAAVGVDAGWLSYRTADGNSVKNYDAGNYSLRQGDFFLRMYPTYSALGNEPQQFDNQETHYSGLSPVTALGGYVPIKNFVLGFGVYTPAGTSTDWSAEMFDSLNGAAINASYFTDTAVTAYNISLSHQLKERCSIGLGLNFLHMDTKLLAHKDYVSSAIPALDYQFDYEENGDGNAWEGVAGLLVKLNDRFSVGAVYRSGATIDVEGQVATFHTGVGAQADTSYTQVFVYPSSYGIGFAYQMSDYLKTTLDWQQEDWRELGSDFNFENPDGVLLTDVDENLDWSQSNQIAWGVEYTASQNMALRGGVRWDQSPLSDDSVSLTNVIDVDKLWLTSGAEYQLRDFKFDVLYAFAHGEDTIHNVEYEVNIHNINVGVTYKF